MKKLEEIEKKNPFKVPDNYFNDLSETLKEQIKQPIKIHKSFYWKKVAVAAAISILILSVAVLNSNIFNTKSNLKTQQFVENSIEDNLVDETTIVNEMIEDTSIVILDKNNTENSESNDDDLDYVAESLDYELLLAEL